MTWIVAGEIAKIHTYLLKAPRLRYLVGGSLLLETFASQVAPALAQKFNGDAPLATAGRFWAEFNDQGQAQQYKEAMQAAGSALFGGDHLLLSGPHQKVKGILKTVADDLEQQKVRGGAKPVNTLVGLQHLERCGACQSWGVLAEPPRDDDRLCQICKYKFLARQRLEIALETPHAVSPYLTITTKVLEPKGESSLEIPFAPNSYLPKGKPFRDFHDIAGETGDLGIFYADGNAMGEIFGKLVEKEDIEGYLKTSNQINKWNEDALEAAATPLGEPFPGAVLVRGGDDLLVALPAREAVQFAQTYLHEISQAGTPFTYGVSGGLVIAKPSLPFRLLLDRAEELLHNAKKQVRLLRQNHQGCTPENLTALDFLVITSSLLEPLPSRPDRLAYPYTSYADFTLFTARPYLISEFKELVDSIKSFKKAWAAPSKFFLDFRDIFRPGALPGTGRINTKGEFVKFRQLCDRYAILYPDQKQVIEEFRTKPFLSCDTWSEVMNSVGMEKKARRLWHADVPDLLDFVEVE